MIYTSIIGGKDPPRGDIPVFRFRMFRNNSRRSSRVYKILSHWFIREKSIWVDGSILPNKSSKELFQELLLDSDIAFFKHPHRSMLGQEIEACYQLKMISTEVREKMRNEFKNSLDLQLLAGGVILRQNTDVVKQFNYRWWTLFESWCDRDQLTLPVAIKQSPNLKVRVIDADIFKNKWFTFRGHAR